MARLTANDFPLIVSKSNGLAALLLGYTLATLWLVLYLAHNPLLPVPEVAEEPDIPDFAAMESIPERKAAFFSFLAPAVESRNRWLREQRQALTNMRDTLSRGRALSSGQRQKLTELSERYGVELEPRALEKSVIKLLVRVDEIPMAMVLAQAAVESAWGTSRFAQEANNYFGQWCYSEGCGLVPRKRAKHRRHEVRRFESPAAAVAAYFYNLNTHRAYAEFRSLRALLRLNRQPLDAEVLVAGLGRYSSRGDRYVEELRTVIRTNDLGDALSFHSAQETGRLREPFYKESTDE